MITKANIYSYKTRGLYEWGSGFVSQKKAALWKDFWKYFDDNGMTPEGKRHYHWNVAISKDNSTSHTLYTTGGCFYLHPMDGEGVFIYAGVDDTSIFRDLCDLLNECARYVGFEIDIVRCPIQIKPLKEQK